MEWLPIESAPKDGTRVLVFDSCVGEATFDPEVEEWYWSGEHWTDAHSSPINPSSWMPLPPPPRQTEREVL